MDKRENEKQAIELYDPPFRYDDRGGYIWDASCNMVADDRTDNGETARVRGWGRIKKLQDPGAIQDCVGEHIAAALTVYWQAKRAGLVPTAEAIKAGFNAWWWRIDQGSDWLAVDVHICPATGLLMTSLPAIYSLDCRAINLDARGGAWNGPCFMLPPPTPSLPSLR